MIHAYLFVNLDTEHENDGIVEDVKRIPQVKEAHRLYGTYDMVLFIEADSTAHLKEITIQSIRRLRYVESTVTFISLASYDKSAE